MTLVQQRNAKINVGNSDLFYFKGDGRLGIGVTDPDSSIEISNAATANLHLEEALMPLLILMRNLKITTVI